MYGEKVEETEELRLDLQDIKDMYKTQVSFTLAVHMLRPFLNSGLQIHHPRKSKSSKIAQIQIKSRGKFFPQIQIHKSTQIQLTLWCHAWDY